MDYEVSDRQLAVWAHFKFVPDVVIAHPFNKSFNIVEGWRPTKDGRDRTAYVLYKGVSLATFRLSFSPSIDSGKEPFVYEPNEEYNTPHGFIKTYGYMAEFTRLSHQLASIPNWTEEMRVDIYANV